MIFITIERNAALVTGKFSREHLATFRSLPGRKRWRQGKLLFEPTSGNIEYVLKHIPNAEWSEEAGKLVKGIEQLREEEQSYKESKDQEVPEDFHFDFKTEPFEKQKKAFYLSKDKEKFALLMEMGTGKTKVIIDTAAYLYGRGKIDTLIVVAPNGVHKQWIEEQVPDHLPDWCPYKAFTYKSGMGKGKQKELQEVLNSENCLKIISMNIESISRDSGKKFLEKMVLVSNPLLAIDESSRIKNPGSNRTKAICKIGKDVKYKRILTGTPVTKGLEDLFSQFKFLDEDILGFSSFYTFRNHFCIMGGFEGRQILSYQNEEELLDRLDGWSFIATKKECLDLPEKIYLTRNVELTKDQSAIYSSLMEDLHAELKDGRFIDANLAIVRLLRTQQVLCGHIPNEEGDGHHIIPSNRVKVCSELVDECSGKIIIFARFIYDVQQLKKELSKKHKVVVYSENKERAKEEFRYGDANIFLANPASAGIGLNLQVANTVIYYSNSFDAEHRWQSEDRMHRAGMKTLEPTYIDLISEGTVDSKIVSALKAKKNISDIVMESPEEFLF